MKDGCQVVWIDTPQLRSYLNDRSKLNSEKQKDHIEVDFRDCAIKYAFELTKTSFKDLHNQYMYHFVIRLVYLITVNLSLNITNTKNVFVS